MKLVKLALGTTLAIGTLTTPAAAVASPTIAQHHACTRTSTGHCIQGGEFCPEADRGKSGWNAYGKRYVCKGPRNETPHWENP